MKAAFAEFGFDFLQRRFAEVADFEQFLVGPVCLGESGVGRVPADLDYAVAFLVVPGFA